jgi:hypothetical protein
MGTSIFHWLVATPNEQPIVEALKNLAPHIAVEFEELRDTQDDERFEWNFLITLELLMDEPKSGEEENLYHDVFATQLSGVLMEDEGRLFWENFATLVVGRYGNKKPTKEWATTLVEVSGSEDEDENRERYPCSCPLCNNSSAHA